MRQFRTGKHYHNYSHPSQPRYASQDNIIREPSIGKTIKVITYNIKLSRKAHEAVELFSRHRQLENADIICLQEMDAKGVELIAGMLHYNYVYYPAILHPRNNKDFGNAILSKWPIIDDEKIILPRLGAGKLQRIAVRATVSVNGTKINIYSVHMKMFVLQHQRRIPIDRIIATIDPSVKHSVVAGDFNTFTRSNSRAVLEPFREADFSHATHTIGWTYKYWYLLNKKSMLDYIFARGMTIIRSGKINDRKASDHIPVWGELKIN